MPPKAVPAKVPAQVAAHQIPVSFQRSNGTTASFTAMQPGWQRVQFDRSNGTHADFAARR